MSHTGVLVQISLILATDVATGVGTRIAVDPSWAGVAPATSDSMQPGWRLEAAFFSSMVRPPPRSVSPRPPSSCRRVTEGPCFPAPNARRAEVMAVWAGDQPTPSMDGSGNGVQLLPQPRFGQGAAPGEHALAGGIQHDRHRLAHEPEVVADGPGGIEHAGIDPAVLADEGPGGPALIQYVHAHELHPPPVVPGHA